MRSRASRRSASCRAASRAASACSAAARRSASCRCRASSARRLACKLACRSVMSGPASGWGRGRRGAAGSASSSLVRAATRRAIASGDWPSVSSSISGSSRRLRGVSGGIGRRSDRSSGPARSVSSSGARARAKTRRARSGSGTERPGSISPRALFGTSPSGVFLRLNFRRSIMRLAPLSGPKGRCPPSRLPRYLKQQAGSCCHAPAALPRDDHQNLSRMRPFWGHC